MAKPADNCDPPAPEGETQGEVWNQCVPIPKGHRQCLDIRHQTQCQAAGCTIRYDGDKMHTLTTAIESIQGSVINNYWIAIPLLIISISIVIIAVNSFKELSFDPSSTNTNSKP